MGSDNAPRTLRVTYEFYIPRGAPGNVRTHQRRAAVEAMTKAVTDIAKDGLPLATSLSVRQEWMYRWDDVPASYSLLEAPDEATGTDGPDMD